MGQPTEVGFDKNSGVSPRLTPVDFDDFDQGIAALANPKYS
jgi:hypothetical protein